MTISAKLADKILEQINLAVRLLRKKKVDDNKILCMRQKKKFLSNDGI